MIPLTAETTNREIDEHLCQLMNAFRAMLEAKRDMLREKQEAQRAEKK